MQKSSEKCYSRSGEQRGRLRIQGPARDLHPRGLLAGLGERAHGRGHMRVRLDVRQSPVLLSLMVNM